MSAGPRVALAAAEVAPFAKRGGLGDVTAALTRELADAGWDVRTFAPLYGEIDRGALDLEAIPPLAALEVPLGAATYRVSAHAARLPDAPEAGRRLVLLDCPELFGGEVYEGDERDALRFALFGRAVVECCCRIGWIPGVLHLHDWHAAPLLLQLLGRARRDPRLAAVRTLLTLHNVAFQGVVARERLGELGLEEIADLLPPDDLAAGRVNLLRAALLHADLLTTVSPTHAEEIVTPQGGAGLHDDLRSLGDRLVGVLNGIDTRVWDPATDPHLPARYSAGDLLGKAVCRRALAEETGLDYDPEAPTAGIVSRLAWQKGFDLAFATLPEVLRESDLRLAVLGTGEARYERFFAELAREMPGRVAYLRAFSEPLAHRIEAGADLFLMPSRYEPCGLNQMYSQRYGTLPLVRATGGLADTVEPYDPDTFRATGVGSGFRFEHFTADGFRWALDLALTTWRDRRTWRRLVDRAMGRDFSWRRRAGEYEALYRRLLDGHLHPPES